MRKFSTHRVGICQGAEVLFSDYESDGPMWAGEGPRALRRTVRFEEPFAEPPVVHVSLAMWDIDHRHNPRMDLSSADVTAEGFAIVFRTWGDTRVARLRASWMAIGPCRHDDDWDVD